MDLEFSHMDLADISRYTGKTCQLNELNLHNPNFFLSMVTQTNGHGSYKNTSTRPRRKDRSLMTRFRIQCYSAGQAIVLRPVASLVFIGKSLWNIFVSILIVMFITFVGMYRLAFLVVMFLKSAVKFFTDVTKSRQRGNWQQYRLRREGSQNGYEQGRIRHKTL